MRVYLVRGDFANKQQAADLLAHVNAMFVRVIKELKKNHAGGVWRDRILYLANNYNPDVLGEHIPTDLNYTSFVRGKGLQIRMCLRTPRDRRVFHDWNTIKFVALHEMCHMMTESMGHEDDFWDSFKFVLQVAGEMGELDLVDYELEPEGYCGISIDHSPLCSGGNPSQLCFRTSVA